jgi:hypothetical protein
VDFGDLLIALLVIVGGLVLIGAGVIAFVMWRFRVPPRGVVAMVGALVHLASPIDVLPEALLGPLGLVDDAGVVTGVAFFVYKLVTARRMLLDAGVPLPGRSSRTRPLK